MRQNPMKNQAPSHSLSQRGSVLVLILVMIALFGALSFAMTDSFKSGGTTISRDKARLAATEIINHLQSVRDGVKALLINGCDITHLNFLNSVYKRVNGNPAEAAAPITSADCAVYGTSGGKVKTTTFEQYLGVYPSTGSNIRPGHFTARFADASLGTSENDLTYITFYMHQTICKEAISLLTGETPEDLAIGTYDTASNNSYTPGTAGTLTPLPMVGNTNFFIFKGSVADPACVIGIVLHAQ